MRRLVDHWWLAGSALMVAVIALTVVLYVGESERNQQKQRATQRQAVTVLSESVNDVLARELTLARVAGTLAGPVKTRWPALSNIVMSQPLANSTAFVEPVSQRQRAAFERRTGLRLFELPKPGVRRPDRRRPLHLVLTAERQADSGRAATGSGPGGQPVAPRTDAGGGADRASARHSAVRVPRHARSQRVAWPCMPRSGNHGRLKGWVSAAYEAQAAGVDGDRAHAGRSPDDPRRRKHPDLQRRERRPGAPR